MKIPENLKTFIDKIKILLVNLIYGLIMFSFLVFIGLFEYFYEYSIFNLFIFLFSNVCKEIVIFINLLDFIEEINIYFLSKIIILAIILIIFILILAFQDSIEFRYINYINQITYKFKNKFDLIMLSSTICLSIVFLCDFEKFLTLHHLHRSTFTPLFTFFNDQISMNFSSFVHIYLIIIYSLIWYLSSLVLIEKKLINYINLFYLFILFASIMLLLSNDWLVFYVVLEIQALSTYILIGLFNKSYLSTESSLKYFVVGSFASIILLFGVSFLYFELGTLNFTEIYLLMYNLTLYNSSYLLFSINLILIGFLVKLGLVPFHLWVADVYSGTRLYITSLLSTPLKLIFLIVFFRVILLNFSGLNFYVLQSNIYIYSLLSIIIGSLSALNQYNLKRLLAFSGISHTGYLILLFSIYTYYSLKSVYLYVIIYFLLLTGLFATLIMISTLYRFEVNKIADLRLIFKINPLLTLIFFTFIFSLIGLPPFAGFLTKLYLLISLIKIQWISTSIIIILVSIISAFYYVRLLKIIFFDKSYFTLFQPNINVNPGLFKSFNLYIISICFLLNLLIIFYPECIHFIAEISVNYQSQLNFYSQAYNP